MRDHHAKLRKLNSKIISIANRRGLHGYAKNLRKQNKTDFKGEFRYEIGKTHPTNKEKAAEKRKRKI